MGGGVVSFVEFPRSVKSDVAKRVALDGVSFDKLTSHLI